MEGSGRSKCLYYIDGGSGDGWFDNGWKVVVVEFVVKIVLVLLVNFWRCRWVWVLSVVVFVVVYCFYVVDEIGVFNFVVDYYIYFFIFVV